MINIEITSKQAEFLISAMEWWQTSGVNFWSAQSAEEIANLIKEAK
jgi:CTP:phosphocholine cytidylyltransferase-like protein